MENTPKETLDAATLPISRILSSHPRERLYVHPLTWTQRHLELLGCRFYCPDSEPLEIKIEIGTSGEAKSQRHAKVLAETSDIVNKIVAIEYIWRGYYGNNFTITRELGFYFARRRVARLNCRAYSLIPPPDEDLDCPPPNHVAWLDLDKVASLRQDRRRKPSYPKDPLRDPYMAAVLIALAQSQRFKSTKQQKQRQQRRDENGIYWRAVLMVTGNGHEWLYIYGASISAEFLNRFDAPSYSPPPMVGGINTAGMTIECGRLRLRPYETFVQRLNTALREAYCATRAVP